MLESGLGRRRPAVSRAGMFGGESPHGRLSARPGQPGDPLPRRPHRLARPKSPCRFRRLGLMAREGDASEEDGGGVAWRGVACVGMETMVHGSFQKRAPANAQCLFACPPVRDQRYPEGGMMCETRRAISRPSKLSHTVGQLVILRTQAHRLQARDSAGRRSGLSLSEPGAVVSGSRKPR